MPRLVLFVWSLALIALLALATETCWPVLIPTLLACAGVGICAKTTRSKDKFVEMVHDSITEHIS